MHSIKRALAPKAKNGETPSHLALTLSTLVDQTVAEISQL